MWLFFGTFLEKDHLKKNQRKKKQICMGQNKEVPCEEIPCCLLLQPSSTIKVQHEKTYWSMRHSMEVKRAKRNTSRWDSKRNLLSSPSVYIKNTIAKAWFILLYLFTMLMTFYFSILTCIIASDLICVIIAQYMYILYSSIIDLCRIVWFVIM